MLLTSYQIQHLTNKHAEADYQEYLLHLTQYFLQLLFKKRTSTEAIADMHLTGGPDSIRYQLGELSIEYFARAYFPEYFEYPVGDFHRQAYLELNKLLNNRPSRRRLARAWPRSFAKSTIYNFFAPLYAALYVKRPFILQCSDTDTQAASFLADLRNACTSSTYILEDFGEVKGRVWRNDLIAVKGDRGLESFVAAIGAGSSARGLRIGQFRPQLITLDDMENDESVLTRDRIEKRSKWLTRTLMPIGDANTDIIYVGTVLAYGCVFDQVLNSPTWDTKKYASIIQESYSEKWQEWTRIYTDLGLAKDERVTRARAFFEEHREELLENTEVLWPEGRPYEVLQATKVEVGDLSFMAEYQNEPLNPAEQIFNREWFAYYDDEQLIARKLRFTDYVGALDPSLGKSNFGDFSAFITLARGDDGFIYVVDAVIERLPVDQIIELIFAKVRQYPYTKIGVEVNQFQELLRMQLSNEAAKRNVLLPLVDIRHNKDKVKRIQGLVPHVKNRYIRFRRDQNLLLDQLEGFGPRARHDDGPDALEMAMKLLGTGALIEGALEGGVDPNFRSRLPYYNKDNPEYADNPYSGGTWTDF